MSDPIFYRLMVLLAKIESTYATDPTLTGAANAILAKNISINPMDGDDVSRDLIRAFLSNQGTIPTGLRVVIDFDTEIAGSGTPGIVPAWGILARACGCAEVIDDNTSVTYSPISELMESLYLKFWLGNTLHAIKGSRGTGKATLNAQGIPIIHWTITGLFIPPAEVARATPTLTAFQEPLLVTSVNTPVFTVNGVSLVMRNYSFDFGNKVDPRLLVGRESIQVTDRGEALDITCEAVPLTTFDPYALALARTLVAVNIIHGTAAGNIVAINAPAAQVKRPKGYQNNQGVAEWQLSLAPQPIRGNDQFSIVLT
jgi:tail tube protein